MIEVKVLFSAGLILLFSMVVGAQGMPSNVSANSGMSVKLQDRVINIDGTMVRFISYDKINGWYVFTRFIDPVDVYVLLDETNGQVQEMTSSPISFSPNGIRFATTGWVNDLEIWRREHHGNVKEAEFKVDKFSTGEITWLDGATIELTPIKHEWGKNVRKRIVRRNNETWSIYEASSK